MSLLSRIIERNIPTDLNPFDNINDGVKKAAENAANDAALNYDKENGDYEDCVLVAAAAAAAGGSAIGGVVGAAIGAGTGLPAARIACRRVFED